MRTTEYPGDTSDRPAGRAWAWAVFPAFVVVLFAALVALDLNGSSIALYADHPEDRGLIAGQPLGVRSDEYLLDTPNAISSALQGNPARAWIGLTDADQSVAAGGGATTEWSSLFKPQDWGLLLLDPSRGIAWSWWFPFVAGLIGVYALFGTITRRIGVSAALAIVATFTPYSAWWFTPAMYVGLGAAAGAAMFAAWTARRRWAAAAFALLAAWLVVCQTLALYPAWQFSVLLVVAAVALGFVLDRRIPWRRVAWTTAVAAAAAGGVVLVWTRIHAAAIGALAGTIYPGQRAVEAGTGSLPVLLGAPLNFWMTGPAGASIGTAEPGSAFGNLSEASASWFPIAFVVLIAAGAVELFVRRRRTRIGGPAGAGVAADRPPLWMLVGTTASIAVLLAWSLLDLPSWFGAVTQLQRIQPSRTGLAIGFASILLLAIASTVRPRPVSWRWPALVGAAVVTGIGTVWAAEHLPWDPALASTALVALSGLVFGGLVALVMSRRFVVLGSALLACYAFVSWVIVNPLQHGIAPLSEDALVLALHEETSGSANHRAIVFGDLGTVGRVRAAGMQSVSGTTPYPDHELMSALAPGQERLWNNYAQYEWTPAEPGAAIEIERVDGSRMRLAVSPCDPTLRELVDPGWVVSETELAGYSCLVPLQRVEGADGRTFSVYRLQ